MAALHDSEKARGTKAGDADRYAADRLRVLAAPAFGRTLLAGTALGLTALWSVGLVVHAEFRERERMQATAHTSQAVLNGLQGLFTLVQGAESGHRGYAITGNEEDLDAYRLAARHLPVRFRMLREAVLQDAEQRQLAAALEQLVREMLLNSARIIDARRQQGAKVAMAMVGTRRSMTVLGDIRRVVARMSGRETAHARTSLADSLDRSTQRFRYLTALLATIAAIVAVAAIVIARTWRRCTIAEGSLHSALIRLRATVDGTMDGLLTIDRAGTIHTMNASAQRMLKCQEDSGERLHVRAFIAPRSALNGEPFTPLRDLMGRVGEVSEVWLRRTDRTVFPAQVALNEIDLDGSRVFVAAIRNVSERHRIDRMKSEFVATVSHELRTPLTSIAGSLALLAGGAAGQLGERGSRLISIAHANSERLVRLVNDILDIEKIESGRVELKAEPVELRRLVAGVIAANRALAESNGMTLKMTFSKEELVVLGDFDHLTRVVTNLLSNAIKFSPPGGVVTIAVGKGRNAGIIRVRDKGPGIPEHFRARLFQRFSQADSSDTRQSGGSGLGLAIVKDIVERHEGSVSAHSPADGGTEFEVRLPLHGARHTPASMLSPDQLTHILLCEHDDDTAAVFCAALERVGFGVSVAATASDAIAQIGKRSFAAVLVDLDLPERHGFDLVHDLRNDSSTNGLPALVVSIKPAGPNFAGEAATLDILDWIAKPIAPEQVVARLNRAMLAIAGTLPLILHVDDDAVVRSLVAEALIGTARLLQAASVEEARMILAQESVDAIILDLDLEGRAGAEILPRAVDANGQPIPLVLLWAEDAGAEVVRHVAAALTTSRVSLDGLVERVHHLVRRHQAAAGRLEGRR